MLRALRVRAVTDAVVREVGYVTGYEGYGLVVLLDLSGPYRAVYAHLGEADVHVGERVRRGERLGLAGCTGAYSGTHLHFEFERAGIPVDPLSFLG